MLYYKKCLQCFDAAVLFYTTRGSAIVNRLLRVTGHVTDKTTQGTHYTYKIVNYQRQHYHTSVIAVKTMQITERASLVLHVPCSFACSVLHMP